MSSLQALLNPAPSGPPSPSDRLPTPQRDYFISPHDSNSSSDNDGSSSPVPPVSPPRRVLTTKSEVDPALALDGYADVVPTSPSEHDEVDDEEDVDEEEDVVPAAVAVPSSPPMPSPLKVKKEAGVGGTGATTMKKKKVTGKTPLPKKKGIARPQKKKRKVVEEDVESFSHSPPPPKQKQKTTPTPTPHPPSPPSKYDPAGQELYCICRKPDSGKWMIGCDGCEDWFHGECINVLESDGDLIDKYFCPSCTSSSQTTTWKRKCRLPTCRRPANVSGPKPSKYCSPAHGSMYFKHQTSGGGALQRDQISAIVDATPNLPALKRLGERIPTPPLSSDAMSDYPEEQMQLRNIAEERRLLERKTEMVEKRLRFITLTQERSRRILEELKADPETSSRKSLKEICGYDDKLSLDDEEWAEFFKGDEGREILASGRISGREGVCLKRKCEKHARWYQLFVEEAQMTERLLVERGKELRSEERKIRERQKRRGIRDGREGTVEVDV
ncbi:COMPASS (complex proteins associated with Set1p) component [Rhizina undulata]